MLLDHRAQMRKSWTRMQDTPLIRLVWGTSLGRAVRLAKSVANYRLQHRARSAVLSVVRVGVSGAGRRGSLIRREAGRLSSSAAECGSLISSFGTGLGRAARRW